MLAFTINRRKVLSNARNAAIVLVAAAVFAEPVTAQQVAGYSLTLVGFVLYNYAKAQSGPHQLPPTTKGHDADSKC